MESSTLLGAGDHMNYSITVGYFYISVLRSACGTELLRLELKAVLQSCLFFSGIRLQPTMYRHSGSHIVPNNCFWRPLTLLGGGGGGSHTRPSRAGVYRCTVPC